MAESIVSGIVSSLVVSGLLALVAWAYNRHRETSLERLIRAGIDPRGVSFEVDGSVGFTIENPTGHEVTIRSVAARSEDDRCSIAFGPRQEEGVEASPRGWVTMPPFTKSRWSQNFTRPRYPIDYSKTFKEFGDLTKLVVTVAFRSLLGTVKLIEIRPARHHEQYMVQAVQHAMLIAPNPPWGMAPGGSPPTTDCVSQQDVGPPPQDAEPCDVPVDGHAPAAPRDTQPTGRPVHFTQG